MYSKYSTVHVLMTSRQARNYLKGLCTSLSPADSDMTEKSTSGEVLLMFFFINFPLLVQILVKLLKWGVLEGNLQKTEKMPKICRDTPDDSASRSPCGQLLFSLWIFLFT